MTASIACCAGTDSCTSARMLHSTVISACTSKYTLCHQALTHSHELTSMYYAVIVAKQSFKAVGCFYFLTSARQHSRLSCADPDYRAEYESSCVLLILSRQSCAVQILTAEQSAKTFVYCYPQAGKPETMLDLLATERGEPSVQSLRDDTSVDDFQHVANWQEVVQYLTTITPSNIHTHIQLLGEST